MSHQILDKTTSPKGFKTFATSSHISDERLDTLVVHSETVCEAVGVFTKSIFASPCVLRSKAHLAHAQQAQTVVVTSKNANVANGKEGDIATDSIIEATSKQLGINNALIQIAATGIIGKKLPTEQIVEKIQLLPHALEPADFLLAAEAIMTTDQSPKAISCLLSNGATLTAIVKGVGMIEPNMATLLLYFFTDASFAQYDQMRSIFKRTMDKTFNCMSVDGDMSTSDTALLLSNGLHPDETNPEEFEEALHDISIRLMKKVLEDGEGASKTMVVQVQAASSVAQAKLVGKSIVNSILVKTSIYGEDLNWGRVIMAIGKCIDQKDISPEQLEIYFGKQQVFPAPEQNNKKMLKRYMKVNREIEIMVVLGSGAHSATVWGCDLSESYVQFNSNYST